MELFRLKHVAIFKPFKVVLEKYQPIRRGGTCIAGKTKSISMSFYSMLSPLSNDLNVTPHLLVFTRNVKVEDMLSKNKTKLFPKETTEKQCKSCQGRSC